MVGQVDGRKVRLLLARQAPPQQAVPQAAQAAPRMPPTIGRERASRRHPPRSPVVPQPQEPADKPQPDDPAAQRPRNEEFVAVPELKPIYFEFDKSGLRPDALDALTNNTAWLRENVDTLVLIEGNCDERGTAEYNLALGDRRAKSAMDYLEANGIAKDRLSTVSYGKERLLCTERTDECMNQNRRADFRIKSR